MSLTAFHGATVTEIPILIEITLTADKWKVGDLNKLEEKSGSYQPEINNLNIGLKASRNHIGKQHGIKPKWA